MEWLEFSVTADGEVAEAVVELFNRHSPSGAVVEVPVDCYEHELLAAPRPAQVLVKTYLPLDGSTDDPGRRLEEGLWHLGQIAPLPPPTIRRLAEEDWANSWKQHYHLVRVGQRTVIVPAWEEYESAAGEVVIRLEPGMAFGTGLHPTTRLCLRALEDRVTPGCSVLDVGTGSGVLAISAAMLGARRVVALDLDPVAVKVARENVARNGVSGQVTVEHGSLAGAPWHGWPTAYGSTDTGPQPLDGREFDLVVVNILAPVIIGMAPALAAHLAPAGRLIASGLVEGQGAGVVEALHACGLEIAETTQETDWIALVAQRE